MTGGLSESDLSRMARTGVGALSTEHGLELFDAGSACGTASVLAAPLDLGRCARRQGRGRCTVVARSGSRTPHRASDHADGSLARRLAGYQRSERHNDRARPHPHRNSDRPRTRHHRGDRSPASIQGPRVRLPSSRRATQPTQHNNRTTTTRHPHIRLPHTNHTRHPPLGEKLMPEGAVTGDSLSDVSSTS